MSDILFQQRGSVGLVILNRVKALNALSHQMIVALEDQLDQWQDDNSIASVVLTSASEKAFSAGGDIRDLYDKRSNPPFRFFRDEYRLNCKIFRYPKPYLSLINGIVMGGGAGISLHGRYVVAGENTTFAMPEVSIGFFPDVGGSYFLPRMRGETGLYCALTGTRLKQGDCLALGLATHTMQSSQFEAVIDRLSNGEEVQAVLKELSTPAAPQMDQAALTTINEIFSNPSVETILEKLALSDAPVAKTALEKISKNSPTSLKVAFEQVRRGGLLEFEDCMIMEFRIVNRILRDQDFYEGVRAALVDKDGLPKWSPPELASVKLEHVMSHFDPMPGEELEFKKP